MKTVKLLGAFILSAVMLFNSTVIGAAAYNFTPYVSDGEGGSVPVTLYSESAYMVNLDTGDVIIDIESDKQRVPASLTKIMTAVVTLERFKDDPEALKTTYAYGDNDAFDELYGLGASTADIRPFEEVTYYDLLCALMIPSACEAANIIAIDTAGSVRKFCDMMNEEAELLGMKNSHFSNAHGLFANQNYSTCEDMAILTKYAIDTFPVFSEIVSKPTYTMSSTSYHPDGTLIINTNEMLDETSDYYYSPVKGVKTGTLDEAGRCLVSVASLEGKNYMIVTMGAPLYDVNTTPDPNNPDSYVNVYYNLIDHKKLYQWAFYHMVSTDFINTNSEVVDCKVEFADKGDSVNLIPAEGYKRDWPDNIEPTEVKRTIDLKENVVAPVHKGDVLGTMTLTYNGMTLTTVDLIATASLERSVTDEKMRIAKSFTSSPEFRLCISGIILLFVGYSAWFIFTLQHKYVRKDRKAKTENEEE